MQHLQHFTHEDFVLNFFSPRCHRDSLSAVLLDAVSFTVTFPLLIPPLCLTTLHIVHTRPAAPPLRKSTTAAAAATCRAHGSSLAPPPPQPSQHERRRFCCSHISPQDTCPVTLSQPRPRPPACLPSLHVDAHACRPPVVIVCAGRWRTPPACGSADQ